MQRGPSGTWVVGPSAGGEKWKAFVPNSLPPDPSLEIDGTLREELDAAYLALGRLDGLTGSLPDTALFLYSYVRKEAVLSSQIEGTQSSLSDLLLFEMKEMPGVPRDDVREVSNYVAATEHGLRRLRSGFPLSNRLLREMHQKLVAKGRGSEKQPGELRTSQNWIGGTRPGNAMFVPPPADRVVECMGDLEKFLHDQPARTPALIKAALAHAQFETIHPFLDGNGRIGRLLATFILCSEGVLREPLLYLSLYLKGNRETYYSLLQGTRLRGEWEEWVFFFVRGVRQMADEAIQTAAALTNVSEKDRGIIQAMGRRAGSALRIHSELQRRPVLSIPVAAKAARLTIPTVTAALESLVDAGIVRELTGRRRNRLFGYKRYLKILNEGTET
ncbi:MAG TPA: Fic family protein [Candidatus Polarisedimenticolia bacterium]|nr:Fic family protein [Candidatus Polarisedimenticolia bacterium]